MASAPNTQTVSLALLKIRNIHRRNRNMNLKSATFRKY